MAATQTKQKTSMFRRIMSPKSKPSDKPKSEKPRPSSLSNAKHLNGHGKNEIVSSLEVENTAYRDPELLHQVYPGRTQSMVYPTSAVSVTNLSPPLPASAPENPPLPPRNVRPASIGHSPQQLVKKAGEEEQPLYVAPADTLNRNPSVIVNPNYSHVETAEVFFSKKDIKKMSMHIETMKQTTGHRRVRSIGHVVDSSEYSTPFDLLKENQARGETTLIPPSVRAILDKSNAPPKPPKNHHRLVKQNDTDAEVDDIIPLISPTPPPTILSDHSHTTSPSSPISTQSSDQDFPPDDGTNDYDEPWHDKFKEFDMPTFRPQGTENTQHFNRAPKYGHHHSDERNRFSAHLGEGGSLVDQHSRGYRGRDPASISPEVPHDRPPTLVKGSYDPCSGRSEGSVSPSPRSRDIRSYSHSQPHHPGFHPPRTDELGHGVNPRANSVGMMATRQLPQTPLERGGSERGLGLDHRYIPKESSPPPLLIDVSIPLEDQPWYHGTITRAQAEAILMDHADFSFIVRKSESSNTNFSLSIRDYTSGFIHLRVILETDPVPGYVLGQFSVSFNTVQECIAFYTKQKLNIRGAEHKKLGVPIPRTHNNVAKFRM